MPVTDPPGADVRDEDKKVVGTTPFVVRVNPGIPTTVELELPGYFTEKLTIQDGIEHEIRIFLEKVQ